jgi:hypothetical protein
LPTWQTEPSSPLVLQIHPVPKNGMGWIIFKPDCRHNRRARLKSARIVNAGLIHLIQYFAFVANLSPKDQICPK